jgi:hypothetical protein
MLRTAIRIFDLVERGEAQRLTELRLWCDTLGISPKGQQDRRWEKPAELPQSQPTRPRAAKPEEYQRLRVVE